MVTLATGLNLKWHVELRAYDDGVAFRYRLLPQEGLREFELRDEVTQFDPAGEPTAVFNALDGFTTSHESLYEHKPLAEQESQTPPGIAWCYLQRRPPCSC